ncbi:MAG: hypothetical protein M3Y28_10090 [Armatimonadota bacterium]|nr:hypothetical protein [Armatimonadota bacterium]
MKSRGVWVVMAQSPQAQGRQQAKRRQQEREQTARASDTPISSQWH